MATANLRKSGPASGCTRRCPLPRSYPGQEEAGRLGFAPLTMLFTLKNLGRLEEATIDLDKDLIVLTGPNNTSKTYVAHAIYAFSTYAGADGPFLYDIIDEYAEQLLPRGDAPMSERIEVDLARLLSDHLGFLLDHVGRLCTARLHDFFATDARFTKRAKITVSTGDGEREAVGRLLDIAYKDTLADAEQRILMEKPQGSGVLIVTRSARLTANGDGGSRVDSLREVAQVHAALVLATALFGTISPAHILTAERSAIEIFSRELAAQRFDPRAKDRPALSYPLALADGLKVAQQMASAQKSTSPYTIEADRLEGEILEGKIEIGPYGEMLFLPTGTTERLDMNLSSSSVKALAGLSFYLRHLARRDDFLIIDEPELNLHPHNQRLIARLFARLARSGIKVMMSTHSDYIVRELNNLIMLSRDKGGKLWEKHGYGEDEILNPERVGAYAFDRAHGRPITIGPVGIKVEAFDRDIKDLNRSASDIYFSLDEQGDEA